jgi:hypothetical protein
MAWPLTKLTTYQIGTVISPDDLNSIQDGVNRLILGTYSVKSLTADGTGGATVAPTAGAVSGQILFPTTAIGSATPPTPTLGSIYKDTIVHAWCVLDVTLAAPSANTLLRGYNFNSSVTHANAGKWDFTFKTNASSSNYAVLLTAYDATGVLGYQFNAFVKAQSTSGFTVYNATSAGSFSDVTLYVLVVGG